MLISNYYHTYNTDDKDYVWWGANVSSSTTYDVIFDTELRNVNNTLYNLKLEAEFNEGAWLDTTDAKYYEIYLEWENKHIGFGYISIKNA